MTYFVYKVGNRATNYPHNWQFVQEFDSYEAAVGAATALCKTQNVTTEPGDGLPAAFFGHANSMRWSAMISACDIQAARK